MREGTITNTNWRLLIVDDEPELLSVMSECLSMQGFDCEVALDGEFATQLLGTQKFDALLIDSLAKNQTLDVIQAFKAAQSHGTVIFFTEK